ncbi:DUF4189 domain-containing protein [Paraburkholderia agricolaris]|jgi:hypothetical protein|uniref:DUF4189 domain-containing protein n=1 Tax=Paraburkholderia agricolaris TaxID=2152888 RepID=UPI0038B6BD53
MKLHAFFITLTLGAAASVITTTAHAQACPPGTSPAAIGNDLSACAPDNTSQRALGPPPERWIDYWGAIAVYEPTGSLGVATNMGSKAKAEQAALADCQSKHGSTCKIGSAYRNGCGALIGSTTGYAVASGPSLDKAIQSGMEICTKSGYQNCHVYYSSCSLPQRIH